MQEKNLINVKFAICLMKILEYYKRAEEEIGNLNLPTSLRSLDSYSGITYNIIQQTSMAKREIQFNTAVRIINGLELTLEQFGRMFDNLTKEDIKKGIEDIEARANKLK